MPRTVSVFVWINLALFILFCDTFKEAMYESVQMLFHLEYLSQMWLIQLLYHDWEVITVACR